MAPPAAPGAQQRALPVSSHAPVLLLALLTLAVAVLPCGEASLADRLKNRTYNLQGDYIGGLSYTRLRGYGCIFVNDTPVAQPLSAESATAATAASCPAAAGANVSREAAVAMGYKWAPILYQHPADSSFLTDPRNWFDQVRRA